MAQCLSNLKQIGLALHMFSQDHDERFPPDLESLYDKYASDPQLFQCSTTPSEMSYTYVSGLSSTGSASWVVAYDKRANHGGDGRNVLVIDGHVKWIEWRDFEHYPAEGLQYPIVNPENLRTF